MNTPSTPNDQHPEAPKQRDLAQNARTGSSGRLRWLLLVIVLGIAAYFIWGRTSKPASPDGQQAATGQGSGKSGSRGAGAGPNSAMPVGVADAKTADVHIYLSGLGSVTPEATTTVQSRVVGQLMKLHFQEGQIVKAGALLAELDPRPYQVMVTQAEGQLAHDTALLKAAQIDLKRYQTLLAQDSIASQLVDTQAALVKQYEGTVKSDQGTLENARLQLVSSRITAPISGRLGLRQVDLGNIVHANDTNGIVTITQTHPISMLFTLPEDTLQDIAKMMAAGSLPVAALSRDGKQQFDIGELTLIDNAIDQTTGTIQLKAKLPNEDGLLWPGQFVMARLHLSTLHDVLTIPAAALQNGPDGSFTFLVKSDGAVEIRKLKLGPVNAETAVVEAGLEDGDLVVTSGQYRLQPGSKVAVEASPPETPLMASKRD